MPPECIGRVISEPEFADYSLVCAVTKGDGRRASFGLYKSKTLLRDLVGIDAAVAFLKSDAPEIEIKLVDRGIFGLANSCLAEGMFDDAILYVTKLIPHTKDAEQKAERFWFVGTVQEKLDHYDCAATAYREGLALEPCEQLKFYFLNNNLGYSLIQLGDFEEAERYCRAAIKTDPGRHNAFKNLGLALQGQRNYVEAARCFLTAAKRRPEDERSMRHLRDLLEAHPWTLNEASDVAADLRNMEQ